MLKSLITTLLFVSVTLLGCNNLAGTDDMSYIEIRDSYTFHVNSAKADDAEGNRGEEMSDPFEIEDARIAVVDGRKYLQVDLLQEQGCEESYSEKFDVVWSGVTIAIYPPQVPLYLSLDSSGCAELKNNVPYTLDIDLYEHFDNKDFADSATYIIVNTSTKEQDPVKVAQSDSQE
jgi:hypothetical protein